MKKMKIVALAVGVVFFTQAVGAQWTAPKRLTWNSGNSENPAVAVDSSGHIDVVWWDTTPVYGEIFYIRSTDGGANWAAGKRLSWNSGNSLVPAIGVDGIGQIHVVWCDTSPGNSEILYRKSTDGGMSWWPIQRLTWTSGESLMPMIGVDPSGVLYVAWADNTPVNYEVYYKKSTDGGVSWTANRRLTWTAGSSYLGDLAVDASGNPHIVWDDDSSGNDEIYYRRSTNGGVTWMPSQRLTWNSGGSVWSAMSVDPWSRVHVVWEDYTPGNFEVFYKQSPDGGSTWATSQRLTWDSGQSRNAAIAVDSAGIPHVVWSDDRTGDFEIYYRKSADGGASWSASQRLTWTASWSQYPAIAADSSGNLHLVWHDSTPGNTEIYYKKYVK